MIATGSPQANFKMLVSTAHLLWFRLQDAHFRFACEFHYPLVNFFVRSAVQTFYFIGTSMSKSCTETIVYVPFSVQDT